MRRLFVSRKFIKNDLPPKTTQHLIPAAPKVDFDGFLMPFWLPFQMPFREPPKPHILQQVSSESSVSTSQGFSFSHKILFNS
jgi:hypothetical protein